jgi:hypothetical protein
MSRHESFASCEGKLLLQFDPWLAAVDAHYVTYREVCTAPCSRWGWTDKTDGRTDGRTRDVGQRHSRSAGGPVSALQRCTGAPWNAKLGPRPHNNAVLSHSNQFAAPNPT